MSPHTTTPPTGVGGPGGGVSRACSGARARNTWRVERASAQLNRRLHVTRAPSPATPPLPPAASALRAAPIRGAAAALRATALRRRAAALRDTARRRGAVRDAAPEDD